MPLDIFHTGQPAAGRLTLEESKNRRILMNIIFSIIAVFGFVASIVVPKGINIMREERARFGEEPALVKEP